MFTYLPDSCRKLEMKVDHIFEGKRLKDHVIRSRDAIDADDCELLCFWEPDCVSFNFKKSMSQCELNNSTFEEQQNKLETHYDYIYREAEASVVFLKAIFVPFRDNSLEKQSEILFKGITPMHYLYPRSQVRREPWKRGWRYFQVVITTPEWGYEVIPILRSLITDVTHPAA